MVALIALKVLAIVHIFQCLNSKHIPCSNPNIYLANSKSTYFPNVDFIPFSGLLAILATQCNRIFSSNILAHTKHFCKCNKDRKKLQYKVTCEQISRDHPPCVLPVLNHVTERMSNLLSCTDFYIGFVLTHTRTHKNTHIIISNIPLCFHWFIKKVMGYISMFIQKYTCITGCTRVVPIIT
jgi:hypothetical protein